MPWDAEAARRKSQAELQAHGLTVADSLPLLGEEDIAELRSADEVAARCRGLYALLAVIHGEAARESDLPADLTGQERRYLEHRDEELETELTWRIEGLLSLGWALGLIEDLPVTGMADGIAEAFAPAFEGGGVVLRPRETLGEKLDLFYCAHWCARENDLTQAFEPWPEAIDPGVVWERRLGLEWIFAPDDDWDEISLDT